MEQNIKEVVVAKLLDKVGIGPLDQDKLHKGELTIEDAFKKVREEQSKLLKADGEFLDGLTQPKVAEERSTFAKLISKEFGLSKDDIKEKSPDEILSIAKIKLTDTVSEKYRDMTDEKVRTSLAEMERMIKARDEQISNFVNVEIPLIRARGKEENDNYRQEVNLNRYLEKSYSDVEISSDLMMSALNIELKKDGYIVKVKESGLPVLLTENNLPVLSADKDKQIDFDDYVVSALKKHRVIKSSNANNSSKQNAQQQVNHEVPTHIIKPSGNNKVLPGMAKALAHLKDLETSQRHAMA